MKLPSAKASQLLGFAVRLIAMVVWAGWAAYTNAGTSSASFVVSATLVSTNAPAASGFCTSDPGRSTFGAVVTVVCGTGAAGDIEAPKTALPPPPLRSDADRYIHVTEFELPSLGVLGGVGSYTGAGTITSWRMVSLADRDYLEVQIGW